MKSVLLVLMLGVVFVSCKKDALTKHLETGLEDYDRARPVNEILIAGIELEKFAIIKTGAETYSVVLKLNDDVIKEEVEKYTVALEAILDDENKLLRDYEAEHNKKGFNFKSELKIVNNHHYLINNIETKMKRFKSLDIWLFLLENEEYKSIGSNRIQIRNIGF
ncbi:hypothetical protein ES676_08390 [Bizionia saleffrena]|uniref:Uncharacterized protein n=1 Tax=Bizionia saleffrena TaxID=291189 RepID=A0A8H2QJA0_9FLAO|nr:hypothetical protein [Bizionia saleffrena]TYB74191.1 hypothetical protein ES676_08390 [Bizionia saleffrena]